MLRETEQDLSNEAKVLDFFASKWKCEWAKLGCGGTYRVDAVLYRDKIPKAFAEVKCYKTNFIGLNVPKYMEMRNLCALTDTNGYLLFSRDDRLGYIHLFEGRMYATGTDLKMAGGTPKGRVPNPDDFEPMYLFNEHQINWVN